MRKFDQLYRCHQILDSRKTPISVSDLVEKLECSRSSVKRYLEDLETYWEAPLEHFPGKGWRYNPEKRDQWQVPGLWMTREESQSLLLLLDILSRFGNGLMDEELKGVRDRIDRILAQRGVSRTDLERRIRIVPVGQRALPGRISDLILQRRGFLRSLPRRQLSTVLSTTVVGGLSNADV